MGLPDSDRKLPQNSIAERINGTNYSSTQNLDTEIVKNYVSLNNFEENLENISNKLDCNFSGNVTYTDFKDNTKVSVNMGITTNATRLSTVIMCLENKSENFRQSVRVLMDSGANSSFITTKCSQQLDLKCIGKSNLAISVFGKNSESRECNIFSTCLFGNLNTSKGIECKLIEIDSIVDKITGYGLTKDQSQFIDENGIILADPDSILHRELGVDILIGQNYFHSFMMDGKLVIPGGLILLPVFNKSYALSGKALATVVEPTTVHTQSLTTKIAHFDTLSPQEEQITLDRFISLEALGIGPIDKEISPILDDFNKTTYHDGERYVVKLPWKSPQKYRLATNFSQAFFRLVSGQKRYRREKYKVEKIKYQEIMKEQLDLGILEKVQSLGTIEEVVKAINDNPHAYDKLAVTTKGVIVHYLAHHGVYKASTGKFRIVYDAQARPAKGAYSLNDCLETGPDLMNSLVGILLRFRKGKFGAKSDIAKAFLMVGIDIKDRDALRLLWVEDGQVWVYRYARLAFGLTSSPYLLAAVLQKHLGAIQLDDDLKDQILSSFYVDDNIYSSDSLEDLLDRKNKSVKIFADAGMNLRQWNSNHPTARKLFHEAEGEELPLEDTVLGLHWNLDTDTISINSKRITDLIGKTPTTKRQLNSFVAQLYDPLGLISPFTAKAKFLVRAAAETCRGWESKLPKDIGEKVKKWTNEFPHVSAIKLPRHVGLVGTTKQMLVGFCDASVSALGACVYLVSSNADETVSHLVMSKSRIKPEPVNAIPRLELTAAEMLCNLMATVRKAFPEIDKDNIYYFTDSSVVIYWLYSGSSSWPVYVANRVRSIRDSTEVEHWLHVDTSENPADIPSRSCDLKDLIGNRLWWNGPKFITKDIRSGKSTLSGYDIAYVLPQPEGIKQEIRISLLISTENNTIDNVKIENVVDINRFGTYEKLMSSTQFILKFETLMLNKIGKIPESLLLQDDKLNKSAMAEVLWIHAVQREHFQELFKLCENPKTSVSPGFKSVFKEHGIFFDKELGVLRCSTRMQHSELKYSAVYPILIPSKSVFTNLLIRHAHERVGHQGVPYTLANLRSEFWILKGRQTIRSVIKNCVACKKVDGPFYSLPSHPPLPDFRVRKARCFNSIGLDFTGPFTVRDPDTMENSKAYMLIFTCAASRGVHLEATRGMSTQDFILGFHRFMDIRGVPERIDSDNGSAFVRANKHLNSIFGSKRVSKFLNQNRISWHFYTEHAPWMGGYIERLNSVFKRVCKKSFSKFVLSFDEFRTMVSYAMAIINCRPLTYVYPDASDQGTVLTPSMLMSGYNLLEPPHLNIRKSKDKDELNFGQRYEVLERLKDSFWGLYSTHYLNEISERHVKEIKAQNKFHKPKIGDIVLIKKEKVKRRDWKLGRILDTRISSRDGEIRECTIKTLSKELRNSIIKRSPSFLIPLEVSESEIISTNTGNKLTHFGKKLKNASKKVRFVGTVNIIEH